MKRKGRETINKGVLITCAEKVIDINYNFINSSYNSFTGNPITLK